MLKSKLIAPLLISIFAFSVVMGVNSDSLFPALGTSGRFSEDNEPYMITARFDNDSFFEDDVISYINWEIDVFLMDGSVITLTALDFDEYITFSLPEGTVLDSTYDLYQITITFLNPVGANLEDYVTIFVESNDPCFFDPFDPVCYTPNFNVTIFDPPTRLTYFAGDTLDLTGLIVDVFDDDFNFFYILNYDDARLSYRSVTTNVLLTQGDVLTLEDANLLIIYEDDEYFNSAPATQPLSLTIYPETPYQFDFVNDAYTLGDNTLSADRSIETFGVSGDDWLLKGQTSDGNDIHITKGMFGEGLILEDDGYDTGYTVSMLSQYLWGMQGMASNNVLNPMGSFPILQYVFIQAYAPFGMSTVSLAINNQTFSAEHSANLSTEAPESDAWMIFPIETVAPVDQRVGHVEITFNNASGGPIYVQQLRIASRSEFGLEDYDQLPGVLNLAHEMSILNSCDDQTTFIQANATDFDNYINDEALSPIVMNLLLLDADVINGDRNELRVTIANKWAMMDTRSQSVFNPPSERRWFTLAVENSLPTIGWSFFTLLSLAFYFKFKLVV